MLEGGTLLGIYGGKIKCRPCLDTQYPYGMGEYILATDKTGGGYFIDSAIEDDNERLLHQIRFGKLRCVNTSRFPGRGCNKNAREPNVEFVGAGLEEDAHLEVRVIKGKSIFPGQELFCSYPFPSVKQLQQSVRSYCVIIIRWDMFLIQSYVQGNAGSDSAAVITY